MFLTRTYNVTDMLPSKYATNAAISIAIMTICLSISSSDVVFAHSSHLFASSKSLLLKQSLLPSKYRFVGSSVTYSVQDWDGGIRPVMMIDENAGWLEGAQESVLDPKKHAVGLSVQLFRSSKGARNDFGQFFTNAHPETVYLPGETWLGGTAVGGLGDRETIYRIEDSYGHCPQHLTSGVSFVYKNAIFSTQTCTLTAGDSGSLNLARRMLQRARALR
jgi:hypothetical protein